MKYIGILLTIIIAWAVRLLCGWIAEKFGTTIDPATQTEAVNYIVGAALIAAIGAVEFFERVIWPPIKIKIAAKWDQWFPMKKP